MTGCFQGFTREEADKKVSLLTDILLEHMFYGMFSAIKWEHFKNVFQEAFRTPKGRLNIYARHPYYLCFNDLVSSILSEQVRMSLGEIDFIFDRQGKMLPRCKRMLEQQKKRVFNPLMRKVLGQVFEGDDKEFMPIQAADLLAWQARNRSWPLTGRITDSAVKLIESRRILYNFISLGQLRYFVKWANWSPATREMLRRYSRGTYLRTSKRVEPKYEE